MATERAYNPEALKKLRELYPTLSALFPVDFEFVNQVVITLVTRGIGEKYGQTPPGGNWRQSDWLEGTQESLFKGAFADATQDRPTRTSYVSDEELESRRNPVGNRGDDPVAPQYQTTKHIGNRGDE